MADLPVDRTTANTPAEHVADHNALHATHNLIDGDGSNGQVLTRVGGVPTWAAPSGSTVSGFFPDMAPSSAHANDDEFNDSTVGAAWTEWDPGNVVTVTEGAYGLKLVAATAGGDSLGGVLRAVPAGDWSLSTKVQLVGNGAVTDPRAGIFVAEDLSANPTTADLITHSLSLEPAMNGIARVGLLRWSAYNAWNANLWVVPGAYATNTHIYLRVRRVSTTLSFDVSSDGISWYQGYSAASPFTAAHVGLFVNGKTAGVTAYFRFWRQTDSGAQDQPLLGRAL